MNMLDTLGVTNDDENKNKEENKKDVNNNNDSSYFNNGYNQSTPVYNTLDTNINNSKISETQTIKEINLNNDLLLSDNIFNNNPITNRGTQNVFSNDVKNDSLDFVEIEDNPTVENVTVKENEELEFVSEEENYNHKENEVKEYQNREFVSEDKFQNLGNKLLGNDDLKFVSVNNNEVHNNVPIDDDLQFVSEENENNDKPLYENKNLIFNEISNDNLAGNKLKNIDDLLNDEFFKDINGNTENIPTPVESLPNHPNIETNLKSSSIPIADIADDNEEFEFEEALETNNIEKNNEHNFSDDIHIKAVESNESKKSKITNYTPTDFLNEFMQNSKPIKENNEQNESNEEQFEFVVIFIKIGRRDC